MTPNLSRSELGVDLTPLCLGRLLTHREECVNAEELDGEVHGVVAQREPVLVGQREHQPTLHAANLGRRATARSAAAVAAAVVAAAAAVAAVAVPRRRRQDLQLDPGVA